MLSPACPALFPKQTANLHRTLHSSKPFPTLSLDHYRLCLCDFAHIISSSAECHFVTLSAWYTPTLQVPAPTASPCKHFPETFESRFSLIPCCSSSPGSTLLLKLLSHCVVTVYGHLPLLSRDCSDLLLIFSPPWSFCTIEPSSASLPGFQTSSGSLRPTEPRANSWPRCDPGGSGPVSSPIPTTLWPVFLPLPYRTAFTCLKIPCSFVSSRLSRCRFPY